MSGKGETTTSGRTSLTASVATRTQSLLADTGIPISFCNQLRRRKSDSPINKISLQGNLW